MGVHDPKPPHGDAYAAAPAHHEPLVVATDGAPSEERTSLPAPSMHAEIFKRIRDAHQLELAEDYVELIADLIAEKGEARLVEVAERLGVTKASASAALTKLKRDGLVVSEPYRALFLTPDGQALAERSKARHEIVYRFLLKIGVPADVASFDSEGMEHHISDVTLEIMRRATEEDR